MRSVFKAWPSRLLATVMTLALLASYAIGAYAHASGHHAPAHHLAEAAQATNTDGPAAHAVQHYASTSEAAATCQHGQTGGTDDGDKPSHAFDCCDTICHGGQAVLAADALVLHPPLSLPAIEPMAAFDGAQPGGLDRPPKALLPA